VIPKVRTGFRGRSRAKQIGGHGRHDPALNLRPFPLPGTAIARLPQLPAGAALYSHDFSAKSETLFTPNFLLAPLALSEMN
jgi:hypothetical protein